MRHIIGSGLLLILLVGGFSSVFAQMSDNDIRALQDRGKAEGWTFTVNKNPATQYSLAQLTGFKVPDNWREMAPFENKAVTRMLPSSFDWRVQVNGMPPVRNQLSCGSCWAFATVGALECNIKVKDHIDVDLSEQWLLSCNQNGYTCDGGWWCHHYFQSSSDHCGGVGAVLEADFPYQHANGTCSCPFPHQYYIDGWGYIGGQWNTPSVEQMKQAILDHGPISVAISANDAFQAYGGGVFNGCSGSDINHAVVIVGWDDNQGPEGVWIIRNSWGPNWGEGGYMRIPYGCQQVGYNATYIDYRGRLAIEADDNLGQSPLAVNFTVGTALQVNSCQWNFGDGQTSTVMAPSHVYQQPGLYTVSLTAQCSDGAHSAQKTDFIAVHADSIKAPHVSSSPGKAIRIDIYARNFLPLSEMTIPVIWGGVMGLTFDSASTAGLRTNGFDVGWPHIDPYTYGRGTFRAATWPGQAQIPPGNGPVVSLFFHIPDEPSATENPILIESYDDGRYIHYPQFTASSGAYTPSVISALVSTCKAGDVSNDGGGPDLTDLSTLVSFLTGGMSQLPNMANANVNGVGVVDLGDLSYLVSYLTSGHPSPVCP